jgi:hypothetical protein
MHIRKPNIISILKRYLLSALEWHARGGLPDARRGGKKRKVFHATWQK